MGYGLRKAKGLRSTSIRYKPIVFKLSVRDLFWVTTGIHVFVTLRTCSLDGASFPIWSWCAVAAVCRRRIRIVLYRPWSIFTVYLVSESGWMMKSDHLGDCMVCILASSLQNLVSFHIWQQKKTDNHSAGLYCIGSLFVSCFSFRPQLNNVCFWQWSRCEWRWNLAKDWL